MDQKIEQYVLMGYKLSYDNPDAKEGIPLDEPWLTYYRQGMEAGREARAESDASYEGPSIGPERSGENWDSYQRHLAEQLEFLFHKHMPHIEPGETEIEGTPALGPLMPID